MSLLPQREINGGGGEPKKENNGGGGYMKESNKPQRRVTEAGASPASTFLLLIPFIYVISYITFYGFV